MVFLFSLILGRFKTFLATGLFMLSSMVFAATAVWRDAGQVKIKFGPSVEARVLFEALDINRSQDSYKSLKTFRSTDERFRLQCKREWFQVKHIYSCVSTINTNVVSNPETTVYKDKNYWRINLDNERDAEALFTALNITEREGRSGYAKAFQTGDRKFELFCTRSKIPFGPKYGCSMAIELN